jgi:hypothetical protein
VCFRTGQTWTVCLVLSKHDYVFIHWLGVTNFVTTQPGMKATSEGKRERKDSEEFYQKGKRWGNAT